MVKRVIIKSGAGSPLRISVPGVDAAGAEFNNLIFDGNQPPLRLHVKGYVSISTIDFTNTQNLRPVTSSDVLPTVPSGTTPIFVVTWRQPLAGGSTAGGMKTVNFNLNTSNTLGGGGGAVTTTSGALRFIGLSCSREGPSGGRFSGDNLINYMIFKNYQ